MMAKPLRAPLLLLLCAAVLLSDCALAQTTRKTPVRSSPNVVSGAIVTLDAAAATVTLKPATGKEITYRYTDRTRFLRAKRAADAAAFKPSDAVVVRFRRSSAGPATLYDLTDRASWEWLDRVRHETTIVTVTEVVEGALRATEGTDATPIEYRATEKTLWSRQGKEATPSDFRAGEKVCVAPRLLPSGAIMAVAVADTGDMAAILKERTRPTVTGTVKAFDAAKAELALHTVAGDERALMLAPDCVARRSSRDVPLSMLRAGQVVTAHLRRNAEGERVVVSVTIQTTPRAKSPAIRRTRPR